MSILNEYKEQIDTIDRILKDKSKLTDKQVNYYNYCKSNLELGYKWMDKCHEPGVYQGIDNLKARQVY